MDWNVKEEGKGAVWYFLNENNEKGFIKDDLR